MLEYQSDKNFKPPKNAKGKKGSEFRSSFETKALQIRLKKRKQNNEGNDITEDSYSPDLKSLWPSAQESRDVRKVKDEESQGSEDESNAKDKD